MISPHSATIRSRSHWERTPCGTGRAQDRYNDYAPWMRKTMPFREFAWRRVFEVGFGRGLDLLEFARGGAMVCGIDLVDRHVEEARARFEKEHRYVPLFHGDAHNIPRPSRTFDLVYSFGVLHHIPDAPVVLREMARILRPGGEVLIGVYHRYSAFWLAATLFWRGIVRGQLLKMPWQDFVAKIEAGNGCPYVRTYSRPQVRRLLTEAGFRGVSVTARHLCWGHWFPWGSGRQVRTGGKWFGWFLIARGRKGP